MKSVAGAAAIVVAAIGVTFLAAQVRADSNSGPLPVVYGFDGTSWTHGNVKPHAIYFGTGGNLLVRALRWVSWTQEAAVARGVRWLDRCVPNCAAGAYVKVPVEMSLWRARIRGGISYFSRMTLYWSIGGRKHKSIYAWSHGPISRVQPFWS